MAQPTAYQRVVDEYDITEAGVTSLEYLSFDGSDDGMATASIDFTATDKMSVFAGVEKESDVRSFIAQYLNAASSAIFLLEHSGTVFGGNNGSYKSVLGRTSGVTNADFSAFVSPADYLGVRKNVLTATSDRSITGNAAATLRIDGAVPASNAAATTGTATSSPAHFDSGVIRLGQNPPGTIFFDGKIFGLIVRGASSTTDEISNTEAYLAARSGVVI